jgi:hypothetical protein
MHSKILALLSNLFLVMLPVSAQKAFELGESMTVENSNPVVVEVMYSGAKPDTGSPYLAGENWKVQWSTTATAPPTRVEVDHIEVDEDDQNLRLVLKGQRPPGDPRMLVWTALFDVDTLHYALIYYTPPLSKADKSCSDKTKRKPLLCPPGPTDMPDISATGSFLAGGGTNPIYSFEVKGGIVFPPQISKYKFHPALTTQVEINQSTKTPNTRTRFDPDSIIAAFALTNITNWKIGPISGSRFQLQLPEGEFSRTDPSSNIIAAGIATLDLKPWQPKSNRHMYGTLYPFAGIEAGRNLNRPHMIDMTPVDLSHYKGIVRGYTGADAALAVVDPNDVTTTLFSITGTYRVRFPTIDEPFIETLHQATTIDMTTKVRHWIEADVNYVIPTWKYLSISATYQYGELPPIFTLTDHRFTIGLKVQAVQTMKDKGTKLVQ